MSFTLSFAAWGLIGGLASVFAELYGLTASRTALLVAVPVLLGSLARLPMGMLTDRFGGRAVFTALLLVSALAAWIVPTTTSYASLLAAAFLLGLAGSYSQKCTHLACAVIPQPERGVLHCPCHEGYFDLRSGRPIAGPPSRPLARILLEVRGRDIYATGVEWRTT